jgi:arylsulfatase A-like enzyme
VLLALSACSKEKEAASKPGPAPAPAVPAASRPATVRADAAWPNIVLISVGTLRRDHLGCYGYNRPTSPRIDKLASEGALFENMVSSSSWTLPAHAAMFTGLADTVHGAIESDKRLSDIHETLAERLKTIGYSTAGFFSGPYLYPAFGLGQGFDAYVDCTAYPELTEKAIEGPGLQVGGPVYQASVVDITSPRVYQHVHDWLQGSPARPFFLFIHLWDVHPDFNPPPPYDKMFDPDYTGTATSEDFLRNPAINPTMPKQDLEHIIALYDGEIAWTDHHVGMILDDLDSLSLRDRTIVMLTADHGEEFFDHGLKGHRHSLFDELIRVPLIVRFPGRVAAGQRYTEQSRMIDVLPTLMDLAGAPPPDNVMGRSLAPLFSGGKHSDELPAVSELYSFGARLRSFRRPDAKMIFNEATSKARVYDLKADPGEQKGLPDLNSPVAQAILRDAQKATAWLAEFRQRLAPAPTPAEVPDKVRDRLKSLGYVGDDGKPEDTSHNQPPASRPSSP